jgi:hypothetical protein
MDTSTCNDLFRGDNRTIAPILVEIVAEMRKWWPLTVRQVFYQAVARRVVSNKVAEYRRVSKILVLLRRRNLLRWDAIEDRTRITWEKRGISNVREFAAAQMESFMDPRYYHRCYVQAQDVYAEVATEKDALSSILTDAIWPYCTRLNVVRGQVSATMVNNMAARFKRAIQAGQSAVLVYLGDLDPSGVVIPKALVRNLHDHHDVDVELRRAALNPEQIRQYDLPESLDAAKTKDPNYRSWRDEYGNQKPVELDALHPQDLTDIVTAALEDAYDMTEFALQRAIEANERAQIRHIRRRVEDVLYTEFPEVFRP